MIGHKLLLFPGKVTLMYHKFELDMVSSGVYFENSRPFSFKT